MVLNVNARLLTLVFPSVWILTTAWDLLQGIPLHFTTHFKTFRPVRMSWYKANISQTASAIPSKDNPRKSRLNRSLLLQTFSKLLWVSGMLLGKFKLQRFSASCEQTQEALSWLHRWSIGSQLLTATPLQFGRLFEDLERVFKLCLSTTNPLLFLL